MTLSKEAQARKAYDEAVEAEAAAGYPGLDEAVEVEFEHPDTGMRFGATIGAYREHYQDQGFVVTNRADRVALVEPFTYEGEPVAVEPEPGSAQADDEGRAQGADLPPANSGDPDATPDQDPE